MKNKFKAFLVALSASIVTMCTPAPAMAQASMPADSAIWIFVAQKPLENGGVQTNLGYLWYFTEEMCQRMGPKLVLSGDPEEKGMCYKMTSVYTIFNKEDARKKQSSI